jgi:hypothetical protein
MYRYLPLILVQIYLSTTLILFFWGPFEWEGIKFSLLATLLILYQLALLIGYFAGLSRSEVSVKNFNTNAWFKFSLLLGVILMIPYIYVYTGKYPWDALQALGDQGGAFIDYYMKLDEERTPGRIAIMLIRTAFSPFLVVIFPLFLWTKRLSLTWKLTFVLYVILYFSFSILRGTDKESGDFFIFILSSLMGLYVLRKSKGQLKLNLKKKVTITSVILLGVLIAFSAFTERKMARLGGDEKLCIAAANVCADMDRGYMSHLGSKSRFGVSVATMYLSIGYYGMGLALNEEFESTLGFGHSIFLLNVLSFFDINVDSSYTTKVSDAGWDAKAYWVTTYTWLANDIGFYGVIFFMFILGFLFSRAWSGIIHANDPVALIVFCQLSMMIVYLPAFNVIMQNIDSYFSLLFWLLVWFLGKLPRFNKHSLKN